MAAYPKILTTYEGLSLISAAAAATAPITITKVMLGDGELGETDQRSLTELISPKLELSLTGIEDLGNGQFQVRAAASNSGLSTGFFAREVGVYAKYSDASGEKLIAYTNGGNYVDYIPDESTPIDSQIFKIDVVIGDASEVTINVKDEAYLTAAELEEHNTSSTAHADIRAALDEAVTDVTYSSGTLTVEKGDGTQATTSIDHVEDINYQSGTMTVTYADGSKPTFAINPVTSVSVSSGVLTAAKADGTNAFAGNVLETMNVAALTDPFDFNDLTTSGFYRIAAPASGIIQEQTNGPTSSPQVGVVWVYPRAGRSASQIFITAAMTDVYMRRYNNMSGAWEDWHQYASLDSSSAGVITTYYTSGTTGYALFSNGYILQWGQVEDLENNVSKVATLPHAMASTQYHLFVHRKGLIEAVSSDTIYILNGRVNSSTQIEVSINALDQASLINWNMSYLVIGQAAT